MDGTLVRGFDYYSGTLWEVTGGGLGSQNALGGGGRYDNLVETLEGKPTPGVGFGSGLERLLIALEAQDVALPDPRRPLVWVVCQSEAAREACRSLVTELRNANIPTDADATGRSMKSQFKLADRENAAWCIIVGDSEVASNTVALKNMKTQEQASVPRGSIIEKPEVMGAGHGSVDDRSFRDAWDDRRDARARGGCADGQRLCGVGEAERQADRRPGAPDRLRQGFTAERPWVRDIAAGALVASGIEVIDLDIVTTPGVAMMVRHLNADGGIVCTASHNPIQWNGLKLLNSQGIAPPKAHADQIIQLYQDSRTDYTRVEHLCPLIKNSETHALHIKRVLGHVDVLGISTKRYKVVLDSVNGAGCVATSTMLNKLGAQLQHLNATPNGLFPHEPEPTEQNLTGLSEEVVRQKAAVGFAQDPDADRLAIIDENGRYIGEEYSLVLCAKWLLSKRPGAAVTNLSTSRMLDDVAAQYGSRVIRTPVGEANVVETMVRENAVVGGEGNGGVIDPRVVYARDSLAGIAYVLQLMAATGKSVSQLVAEIPRYEIVKTKFECRREDANRAVEALKKESAAEKVDLQDGIRIDWDKERAWVHARPSNTEPIMRIIAEAPDRAIAQAKIDHVQGIVRKTLGK